MGDSYTGRSRPLCLWEKSRGRLCPTVTEIIVSVPKVLLSLFPRYALLSDTNNNSMLHSYCLFSLSLSGSLFVRGPIE